MKQCRNSYTVKVNQDKIVKDLKEVLYRIKEYFGVVGEGCWKK